MIRKCPCGDKVCHSFFVSGTGSDGRVEIETALLFEAAPALLELAREYASECANCHGTGLVTVTYGGDGYGGKCAAEADADDQPCPDCADIRAVIAKATEIPAEFRR